MASHPVKSSRRRELGDSDATGKQPSDETFATLDAAWAADEASTLKETEARRALALMEETSGRFLPKFVSSQQST